MSLPIPNRAVSVSLQGAVTSATNNTLTDSNGDWTTDCFKGLYCYAVNPAKTAGQSGYLQIRAITTNSATVITVGANWTTNPDSTYFYYLTDISSPTNITASNNISQVSGTTQTARDWSADFAAISVDSGTASAGGATTLTDSTKAWQTNEHANRIIKVWSGTGAGQEKLVASNTATVVTVGSSWGTNPDATSKYIIEGLGTNITGSSVNISQVGGAALALGQTTKSASIPVTSASDQNLDTLLLNNATQASFPYTSANQTVTLFKHVDVLFTFGAFTGGASPTVQMKIQVVEPTSATVIRTYSGAVLSAAGNDNISVDGLTLGDTVNVTIVATGAPTNITGAYLRLVAKP